MPVAHRDETLGLASPAAPPPAPPPAAGSTPAAATCRPAARSSPSPAPSRERAMIRARNGRTKNGTRRIAGSRNRLSRNGRIASGRSGPPRLNRTIATLRRTHQLQQRRDMLRRGLRHDAVAQIEDERPAPHRLQHRVRLRSAIAAPPATSASGSRLPCAATCAGNMAATAPISLPVSTPTPSTPVAAYSRDHDARQPGKPDHRQTADAAASTPRRSAGPGR